MEKLWTKGAAVNSDKRADDFNSSIAFDSRMYAEDVAGSVAHAEMLAKCGVITAEEADVIVKGLNEILSDLKSGALIFDPDCEDIHTFVESVLTERVGDVGRKLHTARSRNDQVALDLRMYLRGEVDEIKSKTVALIAALTDKAEENFDVIMPGYTHLQRAQPITFGHALMAYAMMLLRDVDRLTDCRKRINVCPIGCCALAGTTFETDRSFEAKRLGFDDIAVNSLDGVSDRDFVIELISCLSTEMMHLSRLAEETVLWSSAEFSFIRLSDAFTTGSSIMPQKKNPDMAELVRGKTGRVYGDLIAALTMMKGLPLAYDKDMQEDKEQVFDACDTVKSCLDVFAGMIRTMTVNADEMKNAAQKGFINATDLADYLAVKGVPFRTAYKIAGKAVEVCVQKGCVLETLPLEDYRALCDAIEKDVYDAVDLNNCVVRRISFGGTSPDSVGKQIEFVRKSIR